MINCVKYCSEIKLINVLLMGRSLVILTMAVSVKWSSIGGGG